MSDTFTCNICGASNVAQVRHREALVCAACGANARFRAVIAGLTGALHGQVAPLPGLRPDRSIRGFGCSDSEIYAGRLAALYDYRNTFLHDQPRVDVCDAGTLQPFQGCRFILCSDVLEHVLEDPALAIGNMHACLAPGGCLVVSTPTYTMPETVERYPSLRGFEVVSIAGRHAVVYETTFGTLGFDPAPLFHGGPGSVLEMRMFSHAALLRTMARTGFSRVTVIGDEAASWGAVWPQIVDRPDLPYPMDGRIVVGIK